MIVCATLGFAAVAQSASLEVAGSPPFDSATQSGFKDGGVSRSCVNDSGTAVGYAIKIGGGGGKRAVRWDASGTAATELGNLGTDNSGYTSSIARALNSEGTAVGFAYKYFSDVSMGARAVRWDASGTPTELGSLGTWGDGRGFADAYAINDAGIVVGRSIKIVSGVGKGERAVRWDAGGTAATELGHLGTDSTGSTNTWANAINCAGTTVGYAEKFDGGFSKGIRAVRWDASGTAATELGSLGTDSIGVTSANAYAINSAGTAVGSANKYESGSSLGFRAVRWNASGTAATELGNLGTDSSGYTEARAFAVNIAGTAVGNATKYDDGISKGTRAVRWDASGTAATELDNLGTSSTGVTTAYANALNSTGTAVGYAKKYVGGVDSGSHATIWLPDASVIDLNDLEVVPVPTGGTWTLTTASTMSQDGFVAGDGSFDPDGSGPLAAYSRHWVAQVGLGGSWTQPAGGVWGQGPNWSTGTPAMQVGNATFDLDATYSVALDRNEQTKSIDVSSGTVSLDLAGHNLAIENNLSIASGAALSIGGAASVFSVAGNATNAGTLEIGERTNVVMDGNLTGSGSTYVEGSLTVHSLTQDSLTIGARMKAVAVPEPSALVLLALASLAMFRHRKLQGV